MTSILYVGMDVHKENYTLCCYSYEKDQLEYQQKLSPDYRMVLKYLEQQVFERVLVSLYQSRKQSDALQDLDK